MMMPIAAAVPQPHSLRRTVSSAYSMVCVVVAVGCLVAGMLVPGAVVLGGVSLHWAAVRMQQ